MTTPSPRWIVAATGESLTEEVADLCRGQDVIAVNDAYRRMPYARALYAADAAWWHLHNGAPGFAGQKWIPVNKVCMDLNKAAADRYGLSMVWGDRELGFSFRPGRVHLGANSGFQAVNLALLWGATTVVLVGFDMRGSHFFGEHPPMARRMPGSKGKGFARWIRHFETAAASLPADRRIINATPGSALTCFPMMTLEEALNA